MLKFPYQGTTYEVDEEHLALAEARLLKKYTKQSTGEWITGLRSGDADSLAGLVFLAKFRAGEQPRFTEIDFDVFELLGALEQLDGDEDADREDDDADEEGGEPDPT